MRTIFAAFGLSLLLVLMTPGAQALEWARQFGGAATGAHFVAVDGSGNVYTQGVFSGTVDFDPGAGVFYMTSAGGSDAFLRITVGLDHENDAVIEALTDYMAA